MLASAGLAEEGVEGVVTTADGLVGGHLAVGLDAVLQAVQLPAGIADLHSGLAHVDGDTLTLHTNKSPVSHRCCFCRHSAARVIIHSNTTDAGKQGRFDRQVRPAADFLPVSVAHTLMQSHSTLKTILHKTAGKRGVEGEITVLLELNSHQT